MRKQENYPCSILVFISCHSVKWIPNVWEISQAGLGENELDWPVWVEYVTYTSHFLTTLSSSTNIFIYFIKHKAELLGSCRRRSSREAVQSEMVTFKQFTQPMAT